MRAGILLSLAILLTGCAAQPSLDSRFTIGSTLFSDDFHTDASQWVAELENGGKIDVHDGKLEIDVPRGCSLWFKHELQGPVLIEYDATMIKGGGPNDRVSDLNCFWMATDPRSPSGLLDIRRSGKLEDYNQLKCYYVGLGGNTNSTTRFRRYIGSATTRPILPEHDLKGQECLLTPNARQKIQLVACDNLIQYYRDGKKLFELSDPAPYTKGWFAFRTVWSHSTIENFNVFRLVAK